MKRLVIEAATEGRTTVTFVSHRYLNSETATGEGKERATETIYLDSFPLDLDPCKLDGVVLISATPLAPVSPSGPTHIWMVFRSSFPKAIFKQFRPG